MNLTNDQLNELKTRYQNGETLKQLAAWLGCSSPTVSSTLKKHGMKVRGRGRRKTKTTVATSVSTPDLQTSGLPDSTQKKLDTVRRKIIADITADQRPA